MGKFYAHGGPEEPIAVGIDLTNTTTGVGLFMWDLWGEARYISKRLTPDEAEKLADEAEKLADELRRVAALVREENS